MTDDPFGDFDLDESELERYPVDETGWDEEENQVMPPLPDEEYESLKNKIDEEGFDKAHPIILDENGRVIDGHHRCEICAELGITYVWAIRKHDLTHEEKIKSAYRENTVRRNLGNGDKRETAKNFYLNHYSGESIRDVAELIGVSRGTVSNAKGELVEVEPDVYEKPSNLDTHEEQEDTDQEESSNLDSDNEDSSNQSEVKSDIQTDLDAIDALREMVERDRIIAAAREINSESDGPCLVCEGEH